MKIGIVCPASLPATQFGGILFLGVDIAKEATKRTNNVTIYTTDLDFANNASTFNKKLPREEKIEGFLIKRSHVWANVNLFFLNPGMYFQLSKDSPDLIHTIGVRSFQSFIASIVSKRKNIPLVISDQGGLTTHPDLNQSKIFRRFLYKLQKPIIKFIINTSRKIIVANEYEKEIFKEFSNESKIEIIRNGINLDIINSDIIDFKQKYNIKNNFILFVGRFNKIKGIDVLLEAINLLKHKIENDDITFVIMGVDFGYEKEMLEKIEFLDIKEKILIIKNPSRQDVISAYHDSKFLALPSRWELSPLTPLEGFAFKKPVISTNVHGIPSTIKNGENGILISDENSSELADAIMELMKNDEKCEKYGLAGHNLVQNECNSKRMASKTLDVYEQVLRNFDN